MVNLCYFINFFNKKYLYFIYLLYLKYSNKSYIYFINQFKYRNKFENNIVGSILNIDKLINIFSSINCNTIYLLDIDVFVNLKYFFKFIEKYFSYSNIDSIKSNLLDDLNLTDKELSKVKIVYKKTIIVLITESYELLLKLFQNKHFLSNSSICIIFLGNKSYYYFIDNLLKKNNITTKTLVFEDCKLISYLNKINLIKQYKEQNIKGFINFKLNNRLFPDIDFINYVSTIIPYLHTVKLKKNKIINIQFYLENKLFNQGEAVESVSSSLNNLFLNYNFNRPLGSWLLCGPSGTGKTELAKILTYSVSNSLSGLIKLNMSEYMESHSVSKLLGSPPGYIGYETNISPFLKVKSDKFFVILFDEIEKAHKTINDLMLQILDEGRLTLSDGTVISFTKTFIIFTSNLGYSFSRISGCNIDKKSVLKSIESFFRIEFLNRLSDIIIFNSIDESNYSSILTKFVNESILRYKFKVNIDNSIRGDFIKYFYNILYGSRPLKRFNEFLFNKFVIFNRLLINKYFYTLNSLYSTSGLNLSNRFNSFVY